MALLRESLKRLQQAWWYKTLLATRSTQMGEIWSPFTPILRQINEALVLVLDLCVDNGVNRLNVDGDALLLTKQINGTWSCKNQSLLGHLNKVKNLMRLFKDIQL